MKVLIVEDEIRIREGIEKLLGRTGRSFEIAGEAENGEEGLTLLRKLRPDIVITDIKMPVMDGLEMLSAMVQENIPARAIVLSAYSEFEYARKAMRLGVTEYLLKPIAYGEFLQALENVEEQLARDRQEKPRQAGTLEEVLHSLVSGRSKPDAALLDYLARQYGVEPESPLCILCVYTGETGEDRNEKVRRFFRHMLSCYPGISFVIPEQEIRGCMVGVVYGVEDASDLERWLQMQILEGTPQQIAVGWTQAGGPEDLYESFLKLFPYLEWNISLDDGVIIFYPKITRIQTASCVYPIELETQIRMAVCADEMPRVRDLLKRFQNSFRDGKVYAPKEIKESYVRFLWAVIGMAKEIGRLDTGKLDQQELLSRIMNAKRRCDLAEAADMLLTHIRAENEDESITHLTVKRVQSMIHEFYQTGITLEEIGNRLNMTPEYLGTLFHREMGVTFSTYLKNYRISRAKELLCGTSLKLYEIAEQSGYADPKYFSKVFKEVTGLLPTNYRKTHR